MAISTPHRAAIAALLGAALLVSGCGRAPTSAPPGGPGRGASTIPASVVLTPQTVVVRGGGRAVKAVSADGATITLDVGSPGAADIKPGSVVLIQDVVVVKAADVRHDGNQLVITAAPVALTELIQNADIRWSNVKVDFKNGTARRWAPGARRSEMIRLPRFAGAMRFPLAAARPLLAVAGGDSGRATGSIGDYAYDAGYAEGNDRINFDARLTGEPNGVTVDVGLKGYLANFEFGGRIDVQNGKADNLNLLLQKLDAEIEIDASGGRKADGAHKGQALLRIPYSYDAPIVIDGIPFIISVQFAVLLNEGITDRNAAASLGAKLTLHGSQGADWQLPGDPKTPPQPKAEGEMTQHEFDIKRHEGVGLGPQALLVAIQFPWVGFGLGWGKAHLGPFIDVVTAASTVYAGAAAIVPCHRGEIVITGSVGIEAEFLGKEFPLTRTEIWRKGSQKARPDIQACKG